MTVLVLSGTASDSLRLDETYYKYLRFNNNDPIGKRYGLKENDPLYYVFLFFFDSVFAAK